MAKLNVCLLMQQDPTADAGQLVTSAEFDRFLSERVHDAEHMPNVAPGSQSTNMGQTNQPPTGGELFSL